MTILHLGVRRATTTSIFAVYILHTILTSCATAVGGPACAKDLDQLYSCINHHRTTTNLSNIVWCMSCGVWSMSDGVNIYRLI